MKFFLLINVKIVGISTFMRRKSSIIGLSELEKAEFLDILYSLAFKISCSAELSIIFFYNFVTRSVELNISKKLILPYYCNIVEMI